MLISKNDKSILQGLAEKVVRIAELPIHNQTIELWRDLNDLKKVRPLVWINEIPWHEMDVDRELELKTSGDFCQQIEKQLRETLYLWNHAPADMVVENKFYSPLVIHDTKFGITEDVDIIKQNEQSDIVSRHFHQQIKDEKDLEKIKLPKITYDEVASERNYQLTQELIGDILVVEKRGIFHQWFAPWDELIRWWDVQDALMDMILRPELVHLAMDKLVNAYLHRLEQYEKLNLLSFSEGNHRVGSGGLAYTGRLPHGNFSKQQVMTNDLWGCSAAQIFSEVSPEMHEEFALQYERRWLEKFGLNYYGCCEPLHNKIDILRSIPNLRKISMSPWIDIEKAVKNIGDNYVFSYKPNPAILATEVWDPLQARKELELIIEQTKGCFVEIIMKDISTLCFEPQRLWEWAEIAKEVVTQ